MMSMIVSSLACASLVHVWTGGTSHQSVDAFLHHPFYYHQRQQRPKLNNAHFSKKEWGIGDDWSKLSEEVEHVFFEPPSSSTGDGNPVAIDQGDLFLDDVIDSIHININAGDVGLYDFKLIDEEFEKYVASEHFFDEAAKEIGMLVRCNEEPVKLLVETGKALEPLTDEERYDGSVLMDVETNTPSQFFNDSIAVIFQEHTVVHDQCLDDVGVARWMTKCLNEKVTKFDKRVRLVLTKYSTFGTGVLTLENFKRIYFDAAKTKSMRKQPNIQSVWRDFDAHQILSPNAVAHKFKQAEIEHKLEAAKQKAEYYATSTEADVLDECEILDWKHEAQISKRTILEKDVLRNKSSHEKLDLASDNATPLRMRDGDFIVIDEESCIGCAQCARIAPSAFMMMEDSGRARTFNQSNDPDVEVAVELCPVSCMHRVAFHELKEFELCRDDGDGRSDHRHMGSGGGHKFTPIHVARRGTDANHKSSWYHYLKQKCHMSKSCPQRGCYDCPHYAKPGDNPFFQKLKKESEKVRIRDYIDSGAADIFRKIAVL